MNALIFFIKQFKSHGWQLILSIALSIILSISAIGLLALSGWFISASAFAGLNIFLASNFNYFLPAATIRYLALMRIISRYFERVTSHDVTFKILTNLRVWFYQKLIPLSPAKLMQKHSSALLSSLVQNIDTLDHLYLRLISPVITAVFVIFFVNIFLFYFSKTICIVVLSSMIFILFLLTTTAAVSGKKMGDDILHFTSALRQKSVDYIQGLGDLLFLINKTERFDALTQNQQHLALAQKKMIRLKGVILSLFSLFSGITIYFILKIGILAVLKNQLNVAELTMIILCAIAAFEQLILLPLAALSVGKTVRAATTILEITSQKPVVLFLNHPDLKINNYHLTISNLKFSYPNTNYDTLNNINLEIRENTKLGIAGPSGSGKTTILNLIARIWDPISGDILIGNNNLKHFSESDLRNQVAFATQKVHIFNDSVRNNLSLFQKNISDETLITILKAVELADYVLSLEYGLNTMMGEFGKHFSGGQIRRISIARALLKNTPILLLDEPSTGLNDDLMFRIWQNCEAHFKNKTVIIATHDEKLLMQMHSVFTL